MTSETKEKKSSDKLLHFIVDTQEQTKTRYTFLMSKATFAAAECEMHDIYQLPKGIEMLDKVLASGSIEKLYRVPISNNGAGVWILADDHSRLLRNWDCYDTTFDVSLQQLTDRSALFVGPICSVCDPIRIGHQQEEMAKATVVVLPDTKTEIDNKSLPQPDG